MYDMLIALWAQWTKQTHCKVHLVPNLELSVKSLYPVQQMFFAQLVIEMCVF